MLSISSNSELSLRRVRAEMRSVESEALESDEPQDGEAALQKEGILPGLIAGPDHPAGSTITGGRQ